jgi:hypothetical protein
MSAMELHIDHLAALVNIGHQLDVRNVYSEHSNLTQRLALDDERDRNYVLTELVCQMRTSVAYRYSEKAPLISEVPDVHMVLIPLDTIADLAQALQWCAATNTNPAKTRNGEPPSLITTPTH